MGQRRTVASNSVGLLTFKTDMGNVAFDQPELPFEFPEPTDAAASTIVGIEQVVDSQIGSEDAAFNMVKFDESGPLED
jgi:hypothetical protein